MQRTLILLKPDCLENKIAGQVISRFENQGYSIMASKMIQLDDELLQEHYAHVAHLPFFPDIAAFMKERMSFKGFATYWDQLIRRWLRLVRSVGTWVLIECETWFMHLMDWTPPRLRSSDFSKPIRFALYPNPPFAKGIRKRLQ